MTLDTETIVQLAYALGVGVLIGLERSLDQRRYDDEQDEKKAAAQSQAAIERASAAPDPEGAGDRADQPEGAEDRADQPEGAEERADQPDPDAAKVELDGAQETPQWPRAFLGVRTFAVLSLVGFAGALAAEQAALLLPVLVGGVCTLVLAMYWRESVHNLGITTEVAAIGTCALGVLCRYAPEKAGVIAVVLTALLYSKRFTYGVVSKMRRVELTDTLKFLVIILIILPLLPNEALDPYEALNPYKVGLLVVLISGISFVGYFLTRILGAQRGLGLTGILGGLTSSTAVTAAMALEAKSHPQLRSICAFSTVAANATMFGRVLAVVVVLNRPLALALVWPIATMAVVAAVAAVILWVTAGKGARGTDTSGAVKLKNPFSIGPALKFAAFFVVILFVAKLAKLYFGDSGLYAASALSGLADVDAITLSVAEQAGTPELTQEVGALAITIAVVSNTVVKTGIALYSGGFAFGRVVALALGLATIAGLVVAAVLS